MYPIYIHNVPCRNLKIQLGKPQNPSLYIVPLNKKKSIHSKWNPFQTKYILNKSLSPCELNRALVLHKMPAHLSEWPVLQPRKKYQFLSQKEKNHTTIFPFQNFQKRKKQPSKDLSFLIQIPHPCPQYNTKKNFQKVQYTKTPKLPNSIPLYHSPRLQLSLVPPKAAVHILLALDPIVLSILNHH